MCSLGDDAQASSSFMPKEDTPIGTTCIKCREARSIIVLRSKDAYCKECFIKGIVHKFKSLLGKRKLIKPNDKVLIVYDGSESATAMLHFIRTGLDLTNPKRLKFEPIVIFVEPDIVVNLPIESRKEKFEELTRVVASQGFQLYFTSYADYVKNRFSVLRIFKNYTEYLERSINVEATRCEKRIGGLSERNLIEDHISREHYIELAKELECKFCFTTELILDVAATIISNIALGRGGLLPMDVGAYDDIDDRVTIIRPMRLLDSTEVQFYNKIYDLKAVDLKALYPKSDFTYDSLQNIVQSFVGNLQENYPATVNTIVRTGDKLGITKSLNVCKLCKCPIENNLGILSSNEATEFSHVASTQSNIIIGNTSFSPELPQEHCFSCRKISKHINVTK